MNDPLGLFSEDTHSTDPLGLFEEEKERPGFVRGAIGTVKAAGDILGGMAKIPAASVLAVGGKIADPSRSLQDSWEAAQAAMEETYPSFGANEQDNPGYTAPMYPFEKFGEGVNWAAKKLSMGNKDVEGAINIGGNFLPIPLVKPMARGLGKVVETIDPGLRNAEFQRPSPKVDVNVLKPEEPVVAPTEPAAARPVPGSPEWVDAQLKLDREMTGREVKMPDPSFEQAHLPFDEPPEGFRHPTSDLVPGMHRIDENGMPINAERSMEAQQLQDPLQRNLWGDELPRQNKQEAPRGLTEAIDRMENLPWEGSPRDEALSRLKHGLESEDLVRAIEQANERVFTKDTANPLITPAGGVRAPRGQRGAIDVAAVKEAIDGFKRGVKSARDVIDSYKGAFTPTELSFLNGHMDNPKDRNGVILLSPEEFHLLAEKRPDEYMKSTMVSEGPEFKRRQVREGLKSDRGLSDVPWLQAYKTADNGQTLIISGHEGRHRMDVFKEMGIDKIPVIIKDSPIRWGESSSRPTKLMGENGIAIKFPEVLNTQYDSNGMKIPRSQRGGIDIKAIEEGLKSDGGKEDSRSMKNLPLVQGERPDTPTHPTQPASIAKKDDHRSKLEASKLLKELAPEYASVATPEEAIALSPKAKDINKNPARDVTISGINGQVFLHRNNPVLNFTRYAIQEWKNAATKFSKDFVTAKDGVATLLGKLSKNEMIQAMEVLQDAAKAKMEINATNIGKLGLTDKQNAFILSVRKALDAQWEMAADSLQMAGRDAFKPRAGYLPSVFTGSYKSLVGVMKDGVFTTRAMAQADTRWGHKQAIESFKKEIAAKGETPVVVPLGRQGMHKAGRGNNLFNGFNDIINTIAEHDPRFAELQLAAQMKTNEAAHKMRGFDVHELHKKGIKGATGENPIRTREQNARDLSKALIDFLEQGADYYSAQKALNDINKVLQDPSTAHLVNTKEVVNQHVKHTTGFDLNPVGNAVNWAVDLPFRAIGISHKVPLAAARGLRTAVGLHMMGLWNPTFAALQLTQVLTGAWPRALDIGGKLNMRNEVSASAFSVPLQVSVMATSHRMGKPVPDFIPKHLQEAFQYAIDNGITTFSELEVATNATRNKRLTQAEHVAATPIVLGERATRAPVFMMFADIFHKFGLDNKEAFMAAQNATGITMGDYHPHERPKIYAQLGVLGEFGGALTTFKHNALTNYWLHGKNAISPDLNGNRHLLPVVAAIAGASFFQGITGSPGYAEADAAYQWATSMMGKRQSLTEGALQSMPDWDKSWSGEDWKNFGKLSGNYGVLSASTGLDFQSRANMSNVLPEFKAGSLSPQLSVLADMGMKLHDYYKFQDQASYNELMKSIAPSGMKGMTEQKLMMNGQGQVTNSAGELMNTEPRSENEQMARNWFAIKPLRETIESNDVYVRSKGLNEVDDKLTVLAVRYRKAVASGDIKGALNLKSDYVKEGGDVLTLDNASEIQEQMVRKDQSQRDRMSGPLQPNKRSVDRWNEMHPQN